jgi:hypothetical protein
MPGNGAVYPYNRSSHPVDREVRPESAYPRLYFFYLFCFRIVRHPSNIEPKAQNYTSGNRCIHSQNFK